jgi:hypothetical protein
LAVSEVPIWLTLTRIELASMLVPSARQFVGHEQIVADQLHAAAQLIGQRLPAHHVVLGHAVLDRAIGYAPASSAK